MQWLCVFKCSGHESVCCWQTWHPQNSQFAFNSSGLEQFCKDAEQILGFRPNLYWRLTWKFISPVFILASRMNERTKEHTNEWMNNRTNRWMNERTNEWTNECTYERMNKWMNLSIAIIVNQPIHRSLESVSKYFLTTDDNHLAYLTRVHSLHPFLTYFLTYADLLLTYWQGIVISSIVSFEPLEYKTYTLGNYTFPVWANVVGWAIALSSMSFIPIVAIYQLCSLRGPWLQVSSLLWWRQGKGREEREGKRREWKWLGSEKAYLIDQSFKTKCNLGPRVRLLFFKIWWRRLR